MVKAPAPCDRWRPGRALAHGICEGCLWDRAEHLAANRSTPTGHGLAPDTQSVAPMAVAVEPEIPVLYCRGCGVGAIVKPPHHPDTWPCPGCGHIGPRSGHPAILAKQELPPALAAIAKEHEKQRSAQANYFDFPDEPHGQLEAEISGSPEMQLAEIQVATELMGEKMLGLSSMPPWREGDTIQEHADDSVTGAD